MCGFAVVVADADLPDASLATSMAAVLPHRGPDDAGSHLAGHVAFAFRRLSILDLSSAGHQPFLSPDGAVALVFNGEIYNYAELRDELTAYGHTFRSTGDTEVLLHSYLQWGTDCMSRLNGMWAFVLSDARRKLVFGSRDRFGVKPLYYSRRGPLHLFASEIKALQTVHRPACEVDWERTARLIAAGGLHNLPEDGATFFREVEQIRPGTCFEIRGDNVRRDRQYWELPEEADVGPYDVERSFAELFQDSVRLRLRSDVPAGVSLSGGIDSTAIISVMGQLRIREQPDALSTLHAFSYMPPEFDETPFIRRTIEQTGARLHPVEITPESFWQGLPALLGQHDEPVHSATAFVGYEIYRAAAAAGVKVILGGQGADETWGGYHPFFRDQWYTLLRQKRWRFLLRELQDYTAGHALGLRAEGFAAMLRYALVTAEQAALYRRMMRPRRFRSAYPFRHLISPDLAAELPPPEPPSEHTLRGMLLNATHRTPLPLYLRIEDRNSMAHSVEARLPFMDYRLVSLAFQLPGEWKIRGKWNKYLLRSALRGTIPEAVRTRVDKMGFPTPASAWFRGPLSKSMLELTTDPSFGRHEVFDNGAVLETQRLHSDSTIDAASTLFNIAQVEMWLRMVAARTEASAKGPFTDGSTVAPLAM